MTAFATASSSQGFIIVPERRMAPSSFPLLYIHLHTSVAIYCSLLFKFTNSSLQSYFKGIFYSCRDSIYQILTSRNINTLKANKKNKQQIFISVLFRQGRPEKTHMKEALAFLLGLFVAG